MDEGMMPPAFSSGGSSQDRSYSHGPDEGSQTPAERPGALPDDPQLLEQVIRQTLMLDQSTAAENHVQVQALREVASRHGGAEFALDPIAVEMVQAIFSAQFSGSSAASDRWQTVSRRVAETLYEDPVSRDRLAALWARLAEAK
jgi:hypothetical protein